MNSATGSVVHGWRGWKFRTGVAAAAAAFATVSSPVTEARITRIEVLTVQSATFRGTSFGAVGTYGKIFARAEYSTDVHIIKPVDMSEGNGRVFYEVVNRGNKDLNAFNGEGGNNPSTSVDASTGLLMRMGCTAPRSPAEGDTTCGPDLSEFFTLAVTGVTVKREEFL